MSWTNMDLTGKFSSFLDMFTSLSMSNLKELTFYKKSTGWNKISTQKTQAREFPEK